MVTEAGSGTGAAVIQPVAGRVGLFGGTFDPPHAGHVALAEAARKACGLERVVFVPCRQSPHKPGRAPGAGPEGRLEMVRRATAALPWAEVSDFEVRSDEPSFSWRTAEHFADAAGDSGEGGLFWILGADQWEVLDRWARPERLAELLTFIVAPRGAATPRPRPGFRAVILTDVPKHPASATRIRECLAAGMPTPPGWLAPEVAEFIERHGLYRGNP